MPSLRIIADSLAARSPQPAARRPLASDFRVEQAPSRKTLHSSHSLQRGFSIPLTSA